MIRPTILSAYPPYWAPKAATVQDSNLTGDNSECLRDELPSPCSPLDELAVARLQPRFEDEHEDENDGAPISKCAT